MLIDLISYKQLVEAWRIFVGRKSPGRAARSVVFGR
jgi:hypothetical protein